MHLDNLIIDWIDENDPENPLNWSISQKIIFTFLIGFFTISVYMSSALYTPGIEELMTDLKCSHTVATLPMSLFVIGYGIGPMLFSPLSENATIGRTPIYIITLFIFFILQIIIANLKDIASLCILRFFAGIFASPILATGGASYTDVFKLPYMPVGLGIWGITSFCGPSAGPFFGSILTVKGSWQWNFWFLAISSGVCFIPLFSSYPNPMERQFFIEEHKG